MRVTLRIGDDVIRAWWPSYEHVPPTGPVTLTVHGDVGWFPDPTGPGASADHGTPAQLRSTSADSGRNLTSGLSATHSSSA